MIFSEKKHVSNMSLEVGCESDRGMVRENNEDSILEKRSADGRWNLLVVCDGMGGHLGGKKASSLAVETIGRIFFERLGSQSASEALRMAIAGANEAVYAAGQSDAELNGMGTTCVSLATDGENAFIGHVGDSRCYRVRPREILRMTKDHSHVQRMVDSGLISQAAAKNHPESNILYRCLGQNKTVDVDVLGPIPIARGDRFLLCSDGLHGLVEDRIIAAMALMYSAAEGAKKLIDLAKSRGGTDNVSVLILHRADGNRASGRFLPEKIEVLPKTETPVSNVRAQPSKFRIWPAVTLSLLIGILIGAGATWASFSRILNLRLPFIQIQTPVILAPSSSEQQIQNGIVISEPAVPNDSAENAKPSVVETSIPNLSQPSVSGSPSSSEKQMNISTPRLEKQELKRTDPLKDSAGVKNGK